MGDRNSSAFIAFRVCFNARFYYPIFMILFLDLGLSIEDFALLNAVWAAVIVCLEVPSGALADLVGRRALVVGAGVIMVIEVGILCILPVGNTSLVFWGILANRILSGAAEALASGADEALTYDSLKLDGREGEWPSVLERLTKFRSLAMVGAMVTGAAIYDPSFLNWVLSILGQSPTLTKADTIKLPLILNLVTAVLALLAALRLVEPSADQADEEKLTARQAFRAAIQAGRWILSTPTALVVILAGILFDSVVRQFMTSTSQYFRVISVPDAWLGVLSAVFGVIGFLVSGFARKLAEDRSPRFNFMLLSGATLAGLIGAALAIPYWGLGFVLILSGVMTVGNFLLSQYLNRLTESASRATVLSFKGLAMNLAYGGAGLLYMALVAGLRSRQSSALGSQEVIDAAVFVQTLSWFPGYFIVFAMLFIGLVRLRYPSLNLDRELKEST